MERAKRMNGGQSSTASEAGGEHFTVRVRADGQATGPIPVGAPRAFFGIVAIAFVCLTGFVFAYGVYGEKLTAGVDVACARASFVAGKRMEKLGNYDAAVAQLLRAMQGRFDDPEASYLCARSIGELYLRMGRYSDAVDVYRGLAPEAFTAAGSITAYVTALYRKGDYEEAERLGKVWLEKATAENDVVQMTWSNHTLGLVYLETGRIDQALPYFRAVSEIDPANRANLDIAYVLDQHGRYEEALAQLDALLAHTSPGLLQNEAGELRNQIRNTQNAQ